MVQNVHANVNLFVMNGLCGNDLWFLQKYDAKPFLDSITTPICKIHQFATRPTKVYQGKRMVL